MFKKKRVAKYLTEKGKNLSAFDKLLSDWMRGHLAEMLTALGMRHISIHVDFAPKHEVLCIAVQGRYRELYADIQISPEAFEYGFEQGEVEELEEVALESAEQFYGFIYTAAKAVM